MKDILVAFGRASRSLMRRDIFWHLLWPGLLALVIWAVVALLFVHFLSTAAASRAAKAPETWPLLYLPAIAGAAMVAGALWVAASPNTSSAATSR